MSSRASHEHTRAVTLPSRLDTATRRPSITLLNHHLFIASAIPSDPSSMDALTTPEDSGNSTLPSRSREDRGVPIELKRFRVLIMGRRNAGKTTILRKMCNTREDPVVRDKNGQVVRKMYLHQKLTITIKTIGQISPASSALEPTVEVRRMQAQAVYILC